MPLGTFLAAIHFVAKGLLGLALVALFVAIALTTAHYYAISLDTSLSPSSSSQDEGEPCVEFPEVVTVLCNVEGTPFLDEDAIKLCRHYNPARWVLTSTSGVRTVLIGADCFTGYREKALQ